MTSTMRQAPAPEVPARFLCALSHQLMTDPILTIYGHNYQRSVLLKWFESGNDTCPLTGKTLKFANVISNGALRSNIEFWMEEHSGCFADRSLPFDAANSTINGLFVDQQEIDHAKEWTNKDDFDGIPKSIVVLQQQERKRKLFLKRIFSKQRHAKAA